MTANPKVHGEEAAAPGSDAPAASPATRRLAACTRDPALARALQELAGNDLAVTLVEDLAELPDALMHDVGIALIDAASLDAPVDAVVDGIAAQFPDVRLLVAGQGAEQSMLATRIASQTVFRFVHKPASPQRLKLFIDAAHMQPAAARVVAAPARVATAAPPRPPRAGKPPLTLLLAAGAAVVVAGAAWQFWPGADTGSRPAAASLAPVPAGTTELDTTLERAAAALAANRFVASDGSSAAELYREALRLDPQHRGAADGYDRAIDNALRQAEEALLAGRLDDADRAVEAVRLLEPDSSRLAFLNTQIERDKARLNADASQRQALEARQTQIRGALAQMQTSLQRGALLDPAGSSALTYFREAETVSPSDPAVRSARETLVAALLTAADDELKGRRTATARRHVDAAASIHSSAPGLDVLRRRVDEVSAQLAAAALTPAPAPAAAAPPAAPVETPAPVVQAAPPAPPPAATSPAPAAPQETIVAANSLRNLRRVDVVYPARALEDLISGWVELEFTVARDGSVQDVVVVNAQPARTFDAAAITALRGYRYAPVIRNGEAAAQRARIRMRFTAQDSR